MDFGLILASTLSSNQRIRENAENALRAAAQQNYSVYLASLCSTLCDEGRDGNVRQAAGVAFKNALRNRDAESTWDQLDSVAKSQIKSHLLGTLGSGNGRAGTAAAQAIAAVAFVELPEAAWPELLPTLLKNTQQGDESLRRCSLEAIGFICEEIDPAVLQSSSNDILTAVMGGLRPEEPSIAVRATAGQALLNCLEFARENFERANERDLIMNIVCQATQAKLESIVLPSLECLARIMQLYYPHMGPYMQQAVARLTIEGIGSSEESIALQAIEFWSTVCEIERDLQEAESCEFPCQGFARGALPLLLPALLNSLKQQEDERNEPDSTGDDEWTRSMAAGTCISLVSECVQDEIFAGNILMTFVSEHIALPDWKCRDAAVMAFGSIMDGPSSNVMSAYVSQGLPALVGLLTDSSVAVRDTVAWAVGRIVDFFNELITDEMLSSVVSALARQLEDAPRVATNCCWSLMSAFVHCGDENNQLETSPLSRHYSQVLAALFSATQRPDADTNNLRAAAYQSLANVALFAPMDCIKAVGELQVAILTKLEESQSLTDQIVNADDRMRYSELQSNLCVVLQNCVKKLGRDSAEASAQKIMSCAFSIFANAARGRGSATELEDVLLLIGTLIGELDESEGLDDDCSFARYVNTLMPYLLGTLGNHAEYHLCTVAVGVVGDLSRAMGASLKPYCDNLVGSLLLILQDGSIMRDVKPHAISALGDIGLGLEGAFTNYLAPTMHVLNLASKVAVQDQEDYDELDFVAALRGALLEAYTSFVLALKADRRGISGLAAHVPQIVEFIGVIARDTDRTDAMVRSAIGLVGDMMDAFGPSMKNVFLADWLLGFIQQPLSEPDRVSDATRSIMYRTQNIYRQYI